MVVCKHDFHDMHKSALQRKCKSRAELAKLAWAILPRCSLSYAKKVQIESRTCQACLSNYAEMQLFFCKDTNFLSYKHQNAREIIHIYDSLTLKQAFFRIFGCKFNRYQWYLPNLATIRPNSTLNDISPQKSFLFIVPKSFSFLTLFTIGLFRTRPADIDAQMSGSFYFMKYNKDDKTIDSMGEQ